MTATARDQHRQTCYGVRFDWGLQGAQELSDDGALVVVDVLSFTTTVSIAASLGMEVLPYAWRDDTAEEFAVEREAKLAVGRSQWSEETPWTLSGAAMLRAPFTPRLVLPSPNGSTIAFAGRGTVLAASLRNGRAVAANLIQEGFGSVDRPIVVIAAGEQWPSQTFRPCIEDLIGAGHVIGELSKQGLSCSPEALVASIAFNGIDDICATLESCASGEELANDGHAEDVAVAVEIDADDVVPVLRNGAFVDATSERKRA